jgi:hypothetical protein
MSWSDVCRETFNLNSYLHTDGTVHGTFDVSFRLGSLGLGLALEVFLLARVLPIVSTCGIANLQSDTSVTINATTRTKNAYNFDEGTLGRVELTAGFAGIGHGCL